MTFSLARRLATLYFVGLLALLPCVPSFAAELPLRIFAAASLKTALDEVNTAFQSATGQSVVASYAGSSTLARQISLGAPADVFISANSSWMDDLQHRGLIEADTRSDVLQNALVVIARKGVQPLSDLRDLPQQLGDARLALAQVDAVPAGIYAKDALEAAQIWSDLADRIAQTDNVRAALALVATGATPYGITYATDAHAEPRVDVVFHIPSELHSPIVYPSAATNRRDEAAEYLTFLRSDFAQKFFVEQGFIPVITPE